MGWRSSLTLEEQSNSVGVYGTSGMVHIGRWNRIWGFKVFDEKGKLIFEDRGETDADPAHVRNFLDCMKSRKSPNAEIAIGHSSSSLCHLGNIVARTGRTVRYDPSAERISGDPEAAKLLRREYRKHWATPKGA